MYLQDKEKQGLTAWFKGGEPLIWMNAAAVTVSTLAVIGLLILLAVRGFSHFWPADVFVAEAFLLFRNRVILEDMLYYRT